MGTAPSGTVLPARRPLPANLTQGQRQALEQFMDGQISAGALSSKLDEAEAGAPAAEPDWRPSHEPRRPPATAEHPAATATATATTRRRRGALPVALVSAVVLATVGAFTVASASTSSEPPGHSAAARVTRTSRHRAASRTSRRTLASASSTAEAAAPGRGHRAKQHAASHGRKGAPAGKLQAKAVGKPAGPGSNRGTSTAPPTGGTGSQPNGGAPAGGSPSSGQPTTPSGTTTSGSPTSTSPSGSGTTTSAAPSTSTTPAAS